MNSKEDQTNSEVPNLENESFIEPQKDPNQINEEIRENKLDEKSIEFNEKQFLQLNLKKARLEVLPLNFCCQVVQPRQSLLEDRTLVSVTLATKQLQQPERSCRLQL